MSPYSESYYNSLANLTATAVMMLKSKKVISDWMNFPGTLPRGKTVNYGLK